MPRMERWSAEKLEKESYFAAKADDGGPECKSWRAALSAEWLRRGLVPPIDLNEAWCRRERDLNLEQAKGWKRESS